MAKHTADVIIIGAGVAGLAAAGELSRRGRNVLLIEARDRLGGRVHTERRRGWSGPIELGAQFVHGGNAALKRLLRRHRLALTQVPGANWHWNGGAFEEIDAEKRIAAVTGKIQPRRMAGWSFARFLQERGASLDALDRELGVGFVEGFQAATCDEMSAVAVAGETFDDDDQYVLPQGYDTLVSALASDLDRDRVSLFVRAPCTRVEWGRRSVEVHSPGARFSAAAALVAVPLGVLQARRPERGAVEFVPEIKGRRRIIDGMRMGHVIRVNFRFDRRRWESLCPASLKPKGGAFGFIHSAERVPVWWSLSQDAVLTGWAGGPRAASLSRGTEAEIRSAACDALSRVLHVPEASLRDAVLDTATHDWTRDPYSRGAYTFTRAGWEDASEKLREPMAETLFFAGEATADGSEVGTVHGALASGIRAAKDILAV